MIIVFLGRNGYGKSAAAVEHAVLPSWAAGRQVVSNITLYPEELGFAPELYVPLGDAEWTLPRIGRHVRRLCAVCRSRARSSVCRRCPGGGLVVEVPRVDPHTGELWSITNNRGCALLIDEVTAEFPSRGTLNVPPELQRITKQFRKPDIAPVALTDTSWARIDLLLREVATVVVESQPWTPFGLFRTRPDSPYGWPKYRAFVRRWYDGPSYERADAVNRLELLEAAAVRRTWRRKRVARVFAAYDSTEGVDLADRIACGLCGGQVKLTACRDPKGHGETWRSGAEDRELAAWPLTPEVLETAGLVAEAAALDAGEPALLAAAGTES